MIVNDRGSMKQLHIGKVANRNMGYIVVRRYV